MFSRPTPVTCFIKCKQSGSLCPIQIDQHGRLVDARVRLQRSANNRFPLSAIQQVVNQALYIARQDWAIFSRRYAGFGLRVVVRGLI